MLYAAGGHNIAIEPQLAEFFVRDAKKTINILTAISENNYRRGNDIAIFIINIHAMKSALINVGESELASTASKLEQAGRDQNINLIHSSLPDFIESLQDVIAKLQPYEEDYSDNENQEFEIDKEFFIEKLTAIKVACDSYNKKEDFFWNEIRKNIESYGLSATFIGRNVPKELKNEFIKTYFAHYNKEAYCKMKEDYNKNPFDYLLLYLLLIYGFNRILRFNSKGQFNLPVGNVDFNTNVQKAIIEYFKYVSGKQVSFFNLDFEDFLKKVKPTKNDFVYLDPPYLITFSEYNKIWNEESEMRLIKVIDELNTQNVRFAVSNVLWHRERYNGIFNEWAQKYNIVRVKSNYISFNDNTEKDTYEVLIKNYKESN